MSDYIERQKVKNIRFSGGINHDGFLYVPYKELVDGIKALPSADVVQVVHARWMKEDRGHVEYCAVCDQCGFDWMWSDRGYFKFCPNCGAKMDAQGEE